MKFYYYNNNGPQQNNNNQANQQQQGIQPMQLISQLIPGMQQQQQQQGNNNPQLQQNPQQQMDTDYGPVVNDIRNRALQYKQMREYNKQNQPTFRDRVNMHTANRLMKKDMNRNLHNSIAEETKDKYRQAGVNPDRLLPKAGIALTSRLQASAQKGTERINNLYKKLYPFRYK